MLTLCEAIGQFVEACQAQRFSPHTLADYQYTYKRFIKWLGADGYRVSQIGVDHIQSFMASTTDVSKKTSLNYHIGLSSLWQWMTETGRTPVNVVRQVKPPKPETREITPFTRTEIIALLNAASSGRLARRDRALILLLLDTGMRAAEACGLRMNKLSLPGRKVLVMGKLDKERGLTISARTFEALSEYLSSGKTNPRDYVFRSEAGSRLTRGGLLQSCYRWADRGQVIAAHPHRFRHTFAIEFLRNGGNIYALQKIMGHTTLDMVKRYLAIVQADIENQMRLASPVENWEL